MWHEERLSHVVASLFEAGVTRTVRAAEEPASAFDPVADHLALTVLATGASL